MFLSATMCHKASDSQKEKQRLPNVLLISLDACRADHLSCYGYNRKTSPFLDEIASDGIRFSNAFANTHGTKPSHTTILTSLYQETHKVAYHAIEEKPPLDPVPTQVLMLQEILKVYGYITLGVTDGGQLGHEFGFDRGYIEYDDQGGGVISGCQKLVELISKYQSIGNPIFAFYHTYEVHSPYFPPENYKHIFGAYRSEFIPTSENLLKVTDTAWRDLSKKDIEFLKAMYDSEIRFTDDTLRTTFDKLKKLGFLKNCIVVITADHGEEFGEHGGVLHRKHLYDELLKVPLIISGTDLPKGKVDERLASSVDIVPTVLAYLGLKARTPMAGRDLLAFRSKSPEAEEAVFSQYGNLRYSIRTRNWKFIETIKPHKLELCDLRQDPQEQMNIAIQYPNVITLFRSLLETWKKNQFDLLIQKEGKVRLTKELIDRLRSLGYVY